ncbi:MAG TPA: serine/threonine-protein kinase [Gemmatimonadales bacterium]|nr:serine/threonine-protein kinase [Gemmatimonadales bacterium]
MPRDLLPVVQSALSDRYAVEREIARGGAARIFLARDRSGTQVALKILHPELAVSLTAERFLREISLLSRIDHPRICRLLDYGERDWLVYFVMSYVEGPTLRQYLDRVRRASIEDTLRGGSDVLEALEYAHGLGVVHRDVKPDNIKLSPAGAVLMDFGIAKAVAASAAGASRLTRSGFTVGTSAYMSPEQVAGQQTIDHRSDLYSVGCVIYECLTGAPPYEHTDDRLVLGMHMRSAIPDARKRRSDTPAKLAKLVSRALAKNPGDRWQSAAEMGAALRECGPPPA